MDVFFNWFYRGWLLFDFVGFFEEFYEMNIGGIYLGDERREYLFSGFDF